MINMCLEQTNKQLTNHSCILTKYMNYIYVYIYIIRTIALRIDLFINYEISIKLEVINLLHKMKHKKHATTSNQDYILSKVFCVWFNILDLHFTQHFFRREIFILPLIKEIVARNLRTIFSHGITINSSFISNFFN